jgi:hypothetical protein
MFPPQDADNAVPVSCILYEEAAKRFRGRSEPEWDADQTDRTDQHDSEYDHADQFDLRPVSYLPTG